MKKTFFSLLLLTAMPQTWACTNLLVGKKASADGSTMVTYSADSYAMYGELYHYPVAKYPAGTLLEVREWDSGKYLGQIAQATETYNVVGNMNEHQLCIGETTFGGREELADSTAIMDYGSLIYIALQRAKTAREAIRVMTGLVEKYGYCSEGESFSIVDKNEVWIMEMVGKGVGNKGAVWVAVRIPEDCIAAHANQSRIHQFPLNDKENCLYAKDVISFAKKKGYYKGADKDFSFANAYNPLDWGGLRFCEARVWSFFNQYTDKGQEWLPYILGETPEPMPLYVKPNKLLSVKNVMDMMRDHYEGTVFDPTQDIAAGPFHSPYRFHPLAFELDGKKYGFERPISTQQTAFTFVGQMRSSLPDAVGGVLWFGVDDARFTVYTPMYACITKIPQCYATGTADFTTFSWESAFWVHNWVANMAYARYNQIIEDVKPLQDQIEKDLITLQANIEPAVLNEADPVAFLTGYSSQMAQITHEQWKKLGEYLIVKYMDGVIKKEDNGQFIKNSYGGSQYPNRPKWDEHFLREIVKQKGNWLEQKELK
ncbi:MAG: Dipeptidase A [Candidatus Ordinivivax streblomastigis]|uniref:Dipeptidase n=1 Tax=Candidatus Ordinivivax streblomastigis TaxID=2540710 RepID=A0A5M8P3N6_9BACT|nr:MAG: Dipeptidase A [Candidatus Ordinivivax streblomastigis]